MKKHRLILCTIFSCVGLFFLSGCSSLFYYPDQHFYFRPEKFKVQPEEFSLNLTQETKIYGWVLRSKTPPKGNILFFHGNAENLTSHYLQLLWLLDFGYNLIIFDYPGYGISTGESTPSSTVAAGKLVLTWISSNQGLYSDLKKPLPLIVFGQSLGGIIAQRVVQDVAGSQAIKAMVLDSTFFSYKGIAYAKLSHGGIFSFLRLLVPLVLSDQWAPKKDQPLRFSKLVMHGTDDVIVPISEGKKNFDQLSEPKEFWEISNGNHTDVFFSHQKKYRKLFVEWLDRL